MFQELGGHSVIEDVCHAGRDSISQNLAVLVRTIVPLARTDIAAVSVKVDLGHLMVDLETLTWPHNREAKVGVVSTNHY